MSLGKTLHTDMISSLDILRITGISRATLNNYIRLGLLPKPLVGKPRTPEMRARQVGYFPSDVLFILEQVHALKKAGKTIPEISALLGPDIPPPKLRALQATPRPRRKSEDPGSSRALQAELFPEMGVLSGPDESSAAAAPPIETLSASPAPQWTAFCVLSARIENFPFLRSALPPEEFFECVRLFRKDVDAAVTAAPVTHAMHGPDGILFFFIRKDDESYLTDAIRFSLELRRIAQGMNAVWQRRKRWSKSIDLNIGVVDTADWLERLEAGSNLDLCVSGTGVEQARSLCDFAHSGSIWTTKTLLSRLHPADRAGLRYGIRLKSGSGEIRTEQVYARILDLYPPGDPNILRFQEIASIPITEIIGEVVPPGEHPAFRPGRIKNLPSSSIIDSKAGK